MKTKTHVRAGLRPIPNNHNETLVRDTGRSKGLTVKTRVKAGGINPQHNETLVRDAGRAKGLTVKTRVKAGGYEHQHNETLVADTPRKR
jgi:hypothetical protein